MKNILKRVCTGFLALATVITTLPATTAHAAEKQYWTESAERVGIIEQVMNDGSIKQGCKYFASLLSSCKERGITDINAAIQSYNFGGGYVGYVAGNGKKHTYNLAENFAKDKSGGKKVAYTNPIAVKKNGAGDIVMAINFMWNLSISIFMSRSLMMKRCRRL